MVAIYERSPQADLETTNNTKCTCLAGHISSQIAQGVREENISCVDENALLSTEVVVG